MRTINEYLDDAKAITGSDYQTARNIGVSRQAVSNMRAKETMSNESAARLAALLKVPFGEVIAACEVGKYPEKRHFWSQWVAVIAIMSVCNISQYPYLTKGYSDFSLGRVIYYAHKSVCDLVRSLIAFIRLFRSERIVYSYG